MSIKNIYLRCALYYVYLHPPRRLLVLGSPPILTTSRNPLLFNVLYLTAYHIPHPLARTYDALTRYNTDMNA